MKSLICILASAALAFSAHGQTNPAGAPGNSAYSGSFTAKSDYYGRLGWSTGGTETGFNTTYGFPWKANRGEARRSGGYDGNYKRYAGYSFHPYFGIDSRTYREDASFLPYVRRADTPGSIRAQRWSGWTRVDDVLVRMFRPDEKRRGIHQWQHDLHTATGTGSAYNRLLTTLESRLVSKNRFLYGKHRMWTVQQRNALSVLKASGVLLNVDYHLYDPQKKEGDNKTGQLLLGIENDF